MSHSRDQRDHARSLLTQALALLHGAEAIAEKAGADATDAMRARAGVRNALASLDGADEAEDLADAGFSAEATMKRLWR